MTVDKYAEDRMVLDSLRQRGIDLSSEYELEFMIAVADENAARQVEKVVNSAGFETEVDFDEGELKEGEKRTAENQDLWPSWTVYIPVTMVPSIENISNQQEKLYHLVCPHGGKLDGWGIET